MAFFRRGSSATYDYLRGFSWHVPGIGGMFTMLAWLLVGAVAGSLVSSAFMLVYKDSGDLMMLVQLISYPIMFIPPMMAAKHISNRNCMFAEGVKPDSDNFSPVGGAALAGICVVGTLALAYVLDIVTAIMPEMPQRLSEVMNQLVSGNVWLNFLCVSIMAPIFEEWLCRGTILKGLLNYERTAKDGRKVRGIAPWAAIVISAAFFALIHMNIWQALPAFLIGIAMGYVYYRTGSLKLTMLMHFTNNTLALILGQIDATSQADTIYEMIPHGLYWAGFAVAACLLVLSFMAVRKVTLKSPQGNCDIIPFDESGEIPSI